MQLYMVSFYRKDLLVSGNQSEHAFSIQYHDLYIHVSPVNNYDLLIKNKNKNASTKPTIYVHVH